MNLREKLQEEMKNGQYNYCVSIMMQEAKNGGTYTYTPSILSDYTINKLRSEGIHIIIHNGACKLSWA